MAVPVEEAAPAVERARDAASRESWAEAYVLLRDFDRHPSRPLAPGDLDILADAAWWAGHIDESVAARLRAHAGHAAAGDHRGAGHAAWWLAFEYRCLGRPAAAAGWLHRARHHLEREPECPEQCYLAWTDAEEAQEHRDPGAALAAALRMNRIARHSGSPDLIALSRQAHAAVLLANGRRAEGLALLDDAMCAVTAGELSGMFTGWLYCLALTECMEAADLGRAVEWTSAAMTWCEAPWSQHVRRPDGMGAPPGAPGAAGAAGTAGTAGPPGTEGTTRTAGTAGPPGTEGTTRTAGTAGPPGTEGTTRTAGTAESPGTEGTASVSDPSAPPITGTASPPATSVADHSRAPGGHPPKASATPAGTASAGPRTSGTTPPHEPTARVGPRAPRTDPPRAAPDLPTPASPRLPGAGPAGGARSVGLPSGGSPPPLSAGAAAPVTDNPFRGLCRIHHVEVLDLLGVWELAEAEAARVCEEILPDSLEAAAEAHYAAGEIRRRQGRLDAAAVSYGHAHELGRIPQPGLALLRLAQGKADAAVAGLKLALACQSDPRHDLLGRARLLAAQTEVALAVRDVDGAAAAVAELEALSPGVALLGAMADTARGALALARHEPPHRPLRRALASWLELRVPYEAAQVRMLLAAADRAAGDDEAARLELAAARSTFERLGALPDARRAAALLAGSRRTLPGGLTEREAEVLRLVAAGGSNRDIARGLTISEHTVARHLNNIFAKLDVTSRTAATAYAYAHGLA